MAQNNDAQSVPDARRDIVLEALLAHEGVQVILDAGSTALGNPLVMVDMSGRFSGLSVSDRYGMAFWERFFSRASREEVLLETERKGIFKRVLESSEPVVGHFSYYENDLLGMRIVGRDGPFAQVAIVEERPLAAGDRELLMFVAEALGMEYSYQGDNVDGSSGLRELMRELLAADMPAPEVGARLDMLGVRLLPHMRLLVVEPSGSPSEIFMRMAASSVSSSIPHVACLAFEGQILAVVDAEADVRRLGEVILRYLEPGSCVGVSPAFGSFAQLREPHEKALAAMGMCRALDKQGAVCIFDDVAPYYPLWRARQAGEDLLALCDPALFVLESYDAENGTQLLPTLEAYLHCHRSMGAAARVLYTHRNTVSYRLERIAELCDIDFEDGDRCFELELSFRLLAMARQ